jgi:hypothetical protein
MGGDYHGRFANGSREVYGTHFPTGHPNSEALVNSISSTPNPAASHPLSMLRPRASFKLRVRTLDILAKSSRDKTGLSAR